MADWDLQHAVMAKGSFLVSRTAAKVLIEQRLGGDIVYISSKNSVFAGPNNIAYSAVKADQAHQVRLLAAELGEHGVRVNGINPYGVVQGSGIFSGGWGANRAAVYGVEEKDLGEFYAQRTLLKREVLPDHFASAVYALVRPGHDPHHRPAHPRRRRRRRRVPALMAGVVAAVDLGASSGRVILGRVGPDTLELTTVHRFPNEPVEVADGLHWNILELYRQGLAARLRLALATEPDLLGIAVDSSGPSTTRCSATGRCSARRPAYRDGRTRRGVEAARTVVDEAELYTRNGLQFLPFNTVYQADGRGRPGRAGRRPPVGPGPAGLLADR